MKKIFALLSMAIVTGCTINVNDANDDHEEHEEFCYERMLYYGDVMQEYPDILKIEKTGHFVNVRE